MSQPLGHILVAHHSINRVLPEILGAYPQHVYSGSLGPDWFYVLHGGFGGYSEVSDTIHRYGARTIYQTMLDEAKNMGNNTDLGEDAYRCFEAARAFAHGFISHVAADSIFHPYVNRRANNPWTGDKHGVSAHAGVETVIDNMLWPRYGGIDIQVDCSQRDDASIADYPVREIIKYGLKAAYPAEYQLHNLLDLDGDLADADHPINKSFRAVSQWSMLTEGMEYVGYNVNDLIQHLKSQSANDVDAETALNEMRNQWCNVDGNGILYYSAEELFHMAVNAAAAAITVGERYVNGEIISFDSCGVPFLDNDPNIDTGLPSGMNSSIDYAEGENRFAVGVQNLSANFTRFAG